MTSQPGPTSREHQSGTDAISSVDVLVVNYATPDLTYLAVAALAGPGLRFFVRDNSSDIDPAALRQAAGDSPLQLLVDGQNVLYAQGNNELFDLGTGDHVLLLNPDVVLTRAALSILLAELRADDGLWAVAPRLLNADGSDQAYFRRLPTLASVLCDRVPPLRLVLRRTWRRYLYADTRLDRRMELEAPPGACLLLGRKAVSGRLFDEAYSLFFNDTDLCLRMSGSGLRVDLVPEASAVHHRGASLDRARDSDRWVVARLYDQNCLTYARRNLRGWPLVALVVAARATVERVALAAHPLLGEARRRRTTGGGARG